MNRKFLVTTDLSPDGIIFSYTGDGLINGIEIMQKDMQEQTRQNILNQTHVILDNFLAWADFVTKKGKAVVIELNMQITFQMMWDKYDDKLRSSKKRSEKTWNKLSEANRVKAFFYIPTYNKNRGAAEKKYLETYLNAELWNN